MRRVRTGDLVQVTAGRSRGETGKVIKVDLKKNRVVIENVNIVKRHTRPTSQDKPSGIVEQPGSVHISNVLPVCSKCGTGVKVRFLNDDAGNKERHCKKCGQVVA